MQTSNKQFDPPPSLRKLREIARTPGKIVPPPVKLGREIMVEHDAQYIGDPVYAAVNVPAGASGRVADILRAA